MDLEQALRLAAAQLADEVPTERLSHEARLGVLRSIAPDTGRDDIYQQMLQWVVERLPDGAIAVRRDKGAHRATGAYYTQHAVVRYMVRRTHALLPDAARLVDPACGAGAFLAGAREFFGPQVHLVGFDTDNAAIELCRSLVPTAAIHQADALLDNGLPAGFDVCIGNPPYISSGLRGAAQQDPLRVAALKQRYPLTAQYKLNTYPLFVERGLNFLRDGGVLAFVLPDSFLSGQYFEGMRRLLLGNTVVELTLVQEDFWEHGKVGQSTILLVKKGPAPAGHTVAVKVCRKVAELETTDPVPTSLSDLVWGPLKRFRLIPSPTTLAIVRAMEEAAGARRLGDELITYSGLIARRGQSSFLRTTLPELAGPWGRLLRSGKEIDRYRLTWAGEEVCLDPELIKSGGCLRYYQEPKLLLRQTADALRAVYDGQGYYCLNNIHLLVPRCPETDLWAMLGLINSRAVSRYYQAMAMESGRLYAQVDLDLLESLPMPPRSPEQTARLHHLARKRQSATPAEAALLDIAIDALVERLYALP